MQSLGDGNFIYRINYDNAYHLKYRLKERSQVGKDVITEKFILGMRIVMLGFEQALKHVKRKPDGEGVTLDDFDDMRQVLARAAASTVLALAENLPKIIDASAVENDEVE